MQLFFHHLKRWLPAVSLLLYAALPASAQDLTDSLDQDQKRIIDAIAPYSSSVRSSILEAATYPQVLVKLERTQARTSQAFQDLLKGFPRQLQEQLYELSRYPDLVNSLVANGKLSAASVQSLLASYPADFQQSVPTLYGPHFDTLVAMNALYQSSQRTFGDLITHYPAPAQLALKEVVDRPEVMTLLTEHIDLTVSLGEAFSADPAGVRQELDSLNRALADQSDQDLTAFKEKVAQDPQLQAEMKKAADDFAKSYAAEAGHPTTVVNNYYTGYSPAPYPYWFGYPYWQPAVWYPTPLYFQTGFYVRPGGRLVVVGLPSAAYSSWFFSLGPMHYPHLYQQYNTYYNIHRTNITNINVYRGFNHAVGNHFQDKHLLMPARTGNAMYRPERIQGFEAPLGQERRTDVSPFRPARSAVAPATPFHFPINRPGGEGFNSHDLNAFHAHYFHQQTWGGMGMRRGRR